MKLTELLEDGWVNMCDNFSYQDSDRGYIELLKLRKENTFILYDTETETIEVTFSISNSYSGGRVEKVIPMP